MARVHTIAETTTHASVATSVNGGSSVVLDQPSTGGGNVVLSIPVQLNLRSGSNTITFSAGQSSACFPSRPPAHVRRAADCVCTGNEGTDVSRFLPARLCCGPGQDHRLLNFATPPVPDVCGLKTRAGRSLICLSPAFPHAEPCMSPGPNANPDFRPVCRFSATECASVQSGSSQVKQASPA